jgi:uncharacterized protein YcbX
MTIILTGLHTYPVKSLRGLSPSSHPVARLGLAHDRRWMLVDADGRFLTQREQHRLALLSTRIDGEKLIIEGAGWAPLVLPLQGPTGAPTQVSVWADQVTALDAGDEPADWFSGFLGVTARLVYFPEDGSRQVDLGFARAGDDTAFSDGFPFLLISEASLADLNARLDAPLPMRRFRPNLVVSGCDAFDEDRWRRIRIGAVEFRVVKPCSRCVITTLDPETAERGTEPLNTLATYRRRDKRIYFGQNLIHDDTGELRLGDAVEVLETAAA